MWGLFNISLWAELRAEIQHISYNCLITFHITIRFFSIFQSEVQLEIYAVFCFLEIQTYWHQNKL